MRFKKPPIRVWARRLSPATKKLSTWDLPHTRLLIVLACLLVAVGMSYLIYELFVALRAPNHNVFGEIRGILLTMAAWIGAPFLIWRTLLADRQTHINRESHYTDLFTKAIESLGATRLDENGAHIPVIESRVGAIYALERLAKHSKTDYGTIVETLSVYVRHHCREPSFFQYADSDPDEEGLSAKEKEQRLWDWCRSLRTWVEGLRNNAPANRADVTVALTVLGRRREGRQWTARLEDEPQPDLGRVNLQGWRMVNDEHFLHDAELGLRDAYLEGASMSGFHIEDSNILGIQIQHKVTHSLVSPRSLIGASLLALTLRSAQYFPILDGADLSFAHMDGAKCENASFRGARLVRADFKNATVRNARFGCANASGAEFDGADLRQTEFIGTLLQDVSLVGANLSGSVFHGAVFHDTELEGALIVRTDFTGARGLEARMIDQSFGTSDTRLPSGLAKPDHWTDRASAIEKWTRFRRERGLGEPV